MRLQMIDRVRPSEADRLWAIATLREEGQFLRRAMERRDLALTEDYGMYSIELATFVARLRDPRSAEALALVIDLTPAVPAALAELGDEAVGPVLRALEVPLLRHGAAYTLRKMRGGGRLSAENVKKVGLALSQ